MTLKLSDKQIKRIAKQIKGQTPTLGELDETFNQEYSTMNLKDFHKEAMDRLKKYAQWMRCHLCGEMFPSDELFYSCCGDPLDGSSGTGCNHDDGEPTCSRCGEKEGWW